jgi:predicted amidohydrolase
MTSMRIACAQTTAELGEVDQNLETIRDMARQASGSGADLVLFPEMMLTGYGSGKVLRPLALSLPGKTSERLAAIARESNTGLAVGLPELDPESGKVFNTLLVLRSDGSEVLRYRKVHLWSTDLDWARPGDCFPVQSYLGCRIGGTICYDVRFPEAARSLALAGAQVILLSTAWLGPIDEWELAVRARAVDNGVFVAASALQGPEYLGSSLIADPHGRIISHGGDAQSNLVIADIDPTEVDHFRARVPLLTDRQPDAYSN